MAEIQSFSLDDDREHVPIAVAAFTEEPPYSTRSHQDKREIHVDPTQQRFGPNIPTMTPSDSTFTIPIWHSVPDSVDPGFVESIKWLQNAFVLQETLDTNVVANRTSPGFHVSSDPLPTYLTFAGLSYLPIAHSSLSADRIRSSVFDPLAQGQWPRITEGDQTPTLFRSFFEALLETVFSIRADLDAFTASAGHPSPWQVAVLCMPRANAYVVGVVPTSSDLTAEGRNHAVSLLAKLVSRVPLGEGLARRKLLSRVCRCVKVNHGAMSYPTRLVTHGPPTEPVQFGFGFLEVEEPFLPLFHSPSEVSALLSPSDFILPLPQRFAVVTERSTKFLTLCFTPIHSPSSGKCCHHLDEGEAVAQWRSENPLPLCDCFSGSIRIDNLQWNLPFGAATPLRDLVLIAAPLTLPASPGQESSTATGPKSEQSLLESMAVAAYLQIEVPPDLDRPVTEYHRIPLSFSPFSQISGEINLRWSALEFFLGPGKKLQDSFTHGNQRVSLIIRGRNTKVSLQATLELNAPMHRKSQDEKHMALAMDEFVERTILYSPLRTSLSPEGTEPQEVIRQVKTRIFTTAAAAVKAFARVETGTRREMNRLLLERNQVTAPSVVVTSVFRDSRVVDTICSYMPLYRLAVSSGVSAMWRQTILRGFHTYPAVISWITTRTVLSRSTPDTDKLQPLSQGEKAGDLLNALRIQALCIKDLTFDPKLMPGSQKRPPPPGNPVSPWYAYTEQLEFFHSPSGVLSLLLLWQNATFRPKEREFHYPAPSDKQHLDWLDKRWSKNVDRYLSAALYRFPAFLREFASQLFVPTFTTMVLDLFGSQVLYVDYASVAKGLLQPWPSTPGFLTHQQRMLPVLDLLSRISCPHWSLNLSQLRIPFGYRDDDGTYHHHADPLLLAFAQHSQLMSKRLFQLSSKEIGDIFFRTVYRGLDERDEKLMSSLACSGLPAEWAIQPPSPGPASSMDFAFAALLRNSHRESQNLISIALRLLVLQKHINKEAVQRVQRNGDVLVTPKLIHSILRDKDASLGLVLAIIKLREWSYDDLTFYPEPRKQPSAGGTTEGAPVLETEKSSQGAVSILEYCVLQKRFRLIPHLLHYFVAFPWVPSKVVWDLENISDLDDTSYWNRVQHMLTEEAQAALSARVCSDEGKRVPLISIVPHLQQLEAMLQKMMDEGNAARAAATAIAKPADGASPVAARSTPPGAGVRQPLHHIKHLLKLTGATPSS